LLSKDEIQKKLNKNEVCVIEHSSGKSDIWKIFGKACNGDTIVKGYVACKACNKVYVYNPSDGTQTLRRHRCDKGSSGPKAKTIYHPQHSQRSTGSQMVSLKFQQMKYLQLLKSS
jgi:hypothetical protein